MDIKDIAKSIRTVLKSTFPATKFSVTISRFSQGSSADVSWTDGPTKTQVNDIISLHGTRSQFINTDRVQSIELANKAVAAWKVQNPKYTHLDITCKGEAECYGIELDGFDSDSDVGFCEDSINEFVRNASFPTVNFILATAATKQEEVLASQPQPTSQPHKLEFVKPVVNVEVRLQEMLKPEGKLINRTDINRVIDVFSSVTSAEMYCEAYDWQAQNLREIDIVQDIYTHALNTELYQIAENKYKTLQSNSSTWFVITTKNRQDVQLTPQPNQLDTLEAELAQAEKELTQAVKTIRKLKGRTAELRVKIKLASTPKQKNANVKLYFDANYVCLGGCADEWWMPDYDGDYVYSHYVRLAYGFNPVGRTERNLLVTCRNYILIPKPVERS